MERISPNAFDKADMSDVRALIDHDSSKILGRTTVGTLQLSIDDIGLRYEISMPNTSYANDLMESMTRGDINQSSFAFVVNYENPEAESWDFNDQTGVYERTINDFGAIYDCSVVTYPAYSNTESIVSQRSLDMVKQNKQNELEAEMQKRSLLLQLDLMMLDVDDDEDEDESNEVGELEYENLVCPNCGGFYDADDNYCPTCGTKLNQNNSMQMGMTE